MVVASLSVGVSLSGTAGAAAARSDHRAGRIIYRGKSAPLRQIARRGTATTLVRPTHSVAGLGGRVQADLAHFDQLNALQGDEGNNAESGFTAPKVPPLPQDLSAPGVLASWEGSNSYANDWSFNGNQFSVEPPDQGLCVGNGFEFETVNQVIQVYDGSGTPLIYGTPFFAGSPAVGLALNEFYGFPPSLDFSTGVFGPFSGDVVCYYDQATQRWFHLMFSIEQDRTSGAFTGNMALELAVSASSNPLGSWNFYEIPAQNNGTQGTPDHGCDGGFCFGDFPKIGADANSIVLTTNEYSFFGSDFNGVQIYALSKADLVAGVSNPTMVYLQNQNVPALGQGGFTAWPAQSSPSSFDSSNGGTEYLVSSTAGDGSETGNTTGGSDKIVVWALTNTSSLDTATPDLGLQQAVVTTIPYVLPPRSFMRSSQGPLALLQCLNLGTSCPALNVSDPPFVQPGPYPLDSSDTRVLSSFFQDGVLWTTVATGLQGTGGSSYAFENNLAQVKLDTKAGVAYFALRPTWSDGSGGEGLAQADATLGADVAQQGYIGIQGGNLIYPSLAIGSNGVGYIGATRVGPQYFASPAYIKVGLGIVPSSVGVVTQGAGPNDGFTGTWEGGFRPRWGDYGSATIDDDGSVWFAAEYTQSRCGLKQFAADITCAFSRGIFENWSTRVTHLSTGVA
ncbi:MAG: hypothetical protein ABI869_06460 [Actinomycetota bacterium]